ncbi:uncharacterized protein LOC114714795 [Neltuma alba]|uniref:uncharacterized protein LOC114714795 n=1 Tax=Neltuma alba TaxID=207710 RepID=UPI0010A2CB6B|nr:uncharacterized protein LOC114714795 [Prosopis alba]
MFCFLRKIILFRRHIINTISPSTSQQLLCFQSQCLPATARYCNSISSSEHSFTVSYLIDTCGFSPKEAAGVSKYLSLETREKPDTVINFLKNLGFSKSQILRVTRRVPQCLRSHPEKTILPKIEFFISRGVSSSDIPKLLCSCPNIMKRSLNKQLIPSFDFFRDLFQSDDKLIKALKSCSGILIDINTLAVPNMKLLREVGVPESNIIKLLQIYPKTVTTSTEKFNIIVERVQEMGFDPLKFQFCIAVYVLSSLSKSTWSKKAKVYKKWGWSDNDIHAAFRSFPFCMKASEDKIDAIMTILVQKLGCPPSTIPTYAVVLSLSLNRRIVPRASVIQVLLSKGLVKKERLLSIFLYTERVFLRRLVISHEEECSELLKLYQAELDLAR